MKTLMSGDAAFARKAIASGKATDDDFWHRFEKRLIATEI